jgi:hypothetical protein
MSMIDHSATTARRRIVVRLCAADAVPIAGLTGKAK